MGIRTTPGMLVGQDYACCLLDLCAGTSLVVHWLRLHAANAGGPCSIPGQGTRSHMPQLRVHMPQLKIPHMATKILSAAAKNWHSQINKYFLKIKNKSACLSLVARDHFNVIETCGFKYSPTGPATFQRSQLQRWVH